MKMKKVLLLLALLLIITGCGKKEEKNDNTNYDAPYLDITYKPKKALACLTFYKDGEYSMYDCDSEPTSYAFDSENDCTYKYYKNRVKFNCKNSVHHRRKVVIDILEWDESKLTLKYDGKKITFYRYD